MNNVGSSLGDPVANPSAVCRWQQPVRNTRIVWAPANRSKDQISICQQNWSVSQQDSGEPSSPEAKVSQTQENRLLQGKDWKVFIFPVDSAILRPSLPFPL